MLADGVRCRPRGIETLELNAFGFTILDPRRRYISIPERRWSIVYAIGEFCWHARGGVYVDEIAYYASKWKTLNKKSIAAGSCYGAKIFGAGENSISQWDRTCNVLKRDPDSRRAIFNFSDDDSDAADIESDIACAVSLQFFIRNSFLDAVCTMRSNDVMLGMSYDVFLFTMLQEMMALTLNVKIGKYHHFVNSIHLYSKDIERASTIIESELTVFQPMPAMKDLSGLPTFLERERLVVLNKTFEFDSALNDYWEIMLSVIKKWEGMNGGVRQSCKIKNPMINELFDLRFG
nr:thymidylate synthase [Pseudomonas sp. P7759]